MRIRSRSQSPRPRVGCAETWASSIDNCIIKAQSSGQNKRRAAPTHTTLIISLFEWLFDSASHFAIPPGSHATPRLPQPSSACHHISLRSLPPSWMSARSCTSAAELVLRIPCMTRSRVHYLRLCKGSYREQSLRGGSKPFLSLSVPSVEHICAQWFILEAGFRAVATKVESSMPGV